MLIRVSCIPSLQHMSLYKAFKFQVIMLPQTGSPVSKQICKWAPIPGLPLLYYRVFVSTFLCFWLKINPKTPVLKLSATSPSLCKADSVCLRHQSKGVTPSTYRIAKGIIALSEHIDFHHKSDETKFTHIKQGDCSLACRQQGNRNRKRQTNPTGSGNLPMVSRLCVWCFNCSWESGKPAALSFLLSGNNIC